MYLFLQECIGCFSLTVASDITSSTCLLVMVWRMRWRKSFATFGPHCSCAWGSYHITSKRNLSYLYPHDKHTTPTHTDRGLKNNLFTVGRRIALGLRSFLHRIKAGTTHTCIHISLKTPTDNDKGLNNDSFTVGHRIALGLRSILHHAK